MREKTRRGRLNEYGNEYGKYAACVLSGFVLYGLSEAVGEIWDPVRDGVLARNEYGGDVPHMMDDLFISATDSRPNDFNPRACSTGELLLGYPIQFS